MMKDSKSIVVGIAASAAVLIATPVVPQPAQKDQEQANPATQGKRDILGFKLGMTKMEVEAAGGKCSPDWDRYRSCSA
jgi:phosphopantothenoylcysteine synthetase/decarboxylase